MAITFPFNMPNDLTEDSFYAGTQKTYNFYITDSVTGSAVDLTSCNCSWNLGYYETKDIYMSASAVVTGSPINLMTVIIPSACTINLDGKFVHQPIITDLSGNTFVPSQGIITIFGRIK